jgi:TonB family protein
MADQSLKENPVPSSNDDEINEISLQKEIPSARRNEEPYNVEDHSWVLFFSFSSWLIITIIFLTGIYKSLLISADKKYPVKKTDDMMRMVIVDQKASKPQVEPDKEYFLSDKNNMGSGKLTEKKGFEALSTSRELRLGKSGDTDKEFEEDDEPKNQEHVLSNHFFSRILDSRVVNENQNKKIVKKFSRSSIPDNYNLRREFIFSWDRNGQPVIPSMFYKHFAYFKSMLDKIQTNWAPPGGSPFPIYGNEYNSYGYVPGRSSYQTFPDQEILIVFTVEPNGDINEIKLLTSMGFDSLDRSCKDAISRSKNFGPPPPELIENDVFIMPLTFRIISHRE